MELSLSFLLFSAILPIITLVFIYQAAYSSRSPKAAGGGAGGKGKSSTTTTNLPLPPGSFGWPVLGETYQFLHGSPQKFVRDRMNKYNPKLFKTKIFGEPTVVLCGTSGNKFLATNEEKLFQSWRPYSMQKIFRSNYQTTASASIPRETEVQVFRAPGFLRPEALVRYVGVMDVQVDEFLEREWATKQEVVVYDSVQLLTATLSARFFLGLKDLGRIAKLAKALDGMSLGLHSIPVYFPGTIFYRAKNSADAIVKEITLLIKEKRAALTSGEKPSDILGFMVANADPSGRHTPDHELAGKVMGLLVAGFSTPSSAITFVTKFIGERPEIYDKVRKEQLQIASSKKNGETLTWEDLNKMKYTWNVAVEIMRHVPPFQGTFRETTTDITYEGFIIPKGWKVFWAISTTNMDPTVFPDPEKFDPSRFEQGNISNIPPYNSIPFGGGPRICPGKEYARLVLLTFIHNLVKGYKWEVLNPDEGMVGNIIPTPAKGLPIRIQKLAVTPMAA